MTPRTLHQRVRVLRPDGPETQRLQRMLRTAGRPGSVWYRTQQEHWLGWLREYGGPGAYGRMTWQGRSAAYVYNHIQCAPMLLYLGEALGLPRRLLRRAADAAAGAGPRGASRCGALRRVIPWATIELAINTSPGATESSRRS